jgi:hypothetical protein
VSGPLASSAAPSTVPVASGSARIALAPVLNSLTQLSACPSSADRARMHNTSMVPSTFWRYVDCVNRDLETCREEPWTS